MMTVYDRFLLNPDGTKKRWWEYPEYVFAVAEWAINEGEIVSPGDVLRFMEKPWKYNDWHAAWDNDQAKQGELQDERRAIL